MSSNSNRPSCLLRCGHATLGDDASLASVLPHLAPNGHFDHSRKLNCYDMKHGMEITFEILFYSIRIIASLLMSCF